MPELNKIILMSRAWLDTCYVEWFTRMPSNADSPAVEAAYGRVRQLNREQVAEYILRQMEQNGVEDVACPFGCHVIEDTP